ncbi:endo alpha-1,4 polygalactosaminidase [Planococcus sp. APC 4015]|nr:endo alpha-1,4 polygalactosaminidase [Planococcus sp. APC 4015]
MHRLPASVIVVVAAFVLTACATTTPAVELPPVGAAPDYQLGAAYEPPSGVGVVARDHTASPADGVYSICYVNGFQTQPSELADWPADLLLDDRDGDVVFDPDWPDEALLDTSTASQRERIADVVIPWIDGCAAAGFDAVEFDNLDTYTRSDGALDRNDNVELAALLVAAAHGSGLAAGQKNAAEDSALLHDAGFDFAISEECAAFDECAAYTSVYGDHVIDIEYSPDAFAGACGHPETPRSVVLRDRDLTSPSSPEYVFALCEAE